MPTAATMGATTAPNQPPVTQSSGQAQPTLLVPFTRASKEHEETFMDVSQQVSAASSIQLAPVDIPAYGFMRSIDLLFEGSGGTYTGVTVVEDAPWSLINEVRVDDVNGVPIFGPVGGYDLYVINKYGGYRPYPIDPKQFPFFVNFAAAVSNAVFSLRVPIEINLRDALGSLANQNSSSAYKLRITLAAATAFVTGGTQTTQPTFRVRATLEAWAQPTSNDLLGKPQATEPENHGTVQFWSKNVIAAPTGVSTQRIIRVGNYIRSLIFVGRDAGNSTRATAAGNWPDPFQFFYDTRLLHSYIRNVWRKRMQERGGAGGAAIETVAGQDNGVFVYDWCHEFDGNYGRELRDGWLPTVQSTRLEFQGSFGAATNVSVITNDIAPKGDVFSY